MRTVDVLRAARRLIDHPSKWTHGLIASDEFGGPVDYMSKRAVRWCAVGAMSVVAHPSNGGCGNIGLREAVEFVETEVGWELASFNDRHTWGDVIGAFDRCITRLETV